MPGMFAVAGKIYLNSPFGLKLQMSPDAFVTDRTRFVHIVFSPVV